MVSVEWSPRRRRPGKLGTLMAEPDMESLLGWREIVEPKEKTGGSRSGS